MRYLVKLIASELSSMDKLVIKQEINEIILD